MHVGLTIENLENAVDRATGRKAIYTEVAMVPIGVSLAPELYDRVRGAAKECKVSLSAFCRQALTAYLDELEAQTGEGDLNA